MYRVLAALGVGKAGILHPGTFTSLAWLNPSQQSRLVELGKVSVVQPPPLAILPGWSRRAQRFEPLGITNVVQFLEANSGDLAIELKYKEATIEKWKRDARKWLVVTPQSGG